MIRPLMEKMQKKGYDAALRKFTFPHVSAALSGVSRLARQAGRAGSSCRRRLALPALLGPLPALLGPLPGPGTSGGSCHRVGRSWQARLAGPAGSPSLGSHPMGPESFRSPALASPAPQGISALAQPFLPGCGFMTVCPFLHAATPRLLCQESPAAPLPVLPAPGALETWLH